MEEPPFMIEASRVVAFARLDPASAAARRAAPVADGVPLESVSGILIAESVADGAVFALYCNESWETLSAERHSDPASAEAAARALFPDSASRWQPYRELTDEERSQLETTRAFLRDLERDFPGRA